MSAFWPKPIIPQPQIIEDIDYLPLILSSKVYHVAKETPLKYAPKLSSTLKSSIYLKREDLQPINSFKCRGAYNKMRTLTDTEKAQGVCCVSAGNHAQGVALAAQKLDIHATIVMPTFAPSIKVENVKRLGGNVILHGSNFDEAKKYCLELAKAKNLVYIPPFDDKYVIAGNGTIGEEIMKQIPDKLDAIFVCCGGGGLIAGIAAYVKRVFPNVKIIGVNSVTSDGLYQSLLQGAPVEIPTAGLFADGTSVKLIGKECFRICRQFVDDMVLVTNDELCAAIKSVYEEDRSILEPSGALALAGCKTYLLNNPQLQGGTFVAIASGANMNFDRLRFFNLHRFVSERTRIGENKEVLFAVTATRYPGYISELAKVISPRVITELSFRLEEAKTGTDIFLGIEASREDGLVVIQNVQEKGWSIIDLTDNEMAKTHGKFMIGGRSEVTDEVIYRFRFPETPGSLDVFLKSLNSTWELTMFHYRNHGSDYGRALVGFKVPIHERANIASFMSQIEKSGCLSIVCETENPFYSHFLK